MACCNWETFEEAFLAAWRKAKHTPSELLIDWRKARTDWMRHHCTGGEAATMQLREFAKDGEYLWVMLPIRRDDDGGMTVKPTPVTV